MRGWSRSSVLAISTTSLVVATSLLPAGSDAATGSVTPSTVAFGTVTSASGTPLAGIDVSLIADRVTMPRPGTTAELPVLAVDVTDASGHYTVDLPADFTGANAVDPSTGLVTFDVIVHGEGINSLATVETELATTTTKSGRVSRPRETTRVDFGGSTSKADVVDPLSEAAADFVDTTPPPDPVVVYPPVDDGGDSYTGKTQKAFVTVVRDFGGRWTAVGAWFSDTTGVNATFDYSTAASSSLGIGVSDSAIGGFHAEGTHTESTSSTQGYPTVHGDQSVLFRTLFTFKEFQYRLCGGRPPGPACQPSIYKVESTQWRGGSDLQQTANPGGFAGWCVPEVRDARWHRGDTKAITWTNGVSIKSVVGIDLSSQTGYSREATLDINFAEGGHRLCGRGDFPGGTPYLLMAKA
jgi:hypothetical protein